MKKFTTLTLSMLAISTFAQDNAPALSGGESNIPDMVNKNDQPLYDFLGQWALFNWFVWFGIIFFACLFGFFIGLFTYLARIRKGKAKGSTGCGCFVALIGFVLGFVFIGWAIVSYGPPWVYAAERRIPSESKSNGSSQATDATTSSNSSNQSDGQPSTTDNSSTGENSEDKS
jgi:hypothetical protein